MIELKPYQAWAQAHLDRIQPESYVFADYGQMVEMRKDGVIYGFASEKSAHPRKEWRRSVENK